MLQSPHPLYGYSGISGQRVWPTVGLYIFYILIYRRAAQGGIRRDTFLGSVSAVELAKILFNDHTSSGHRKNNCFLTHAWVFLSRLKMREGRDESVGRCTAVQAIPHGSGKREGAWFSL